MNQRLSEDLVQYLFTQLIHGLDYLHSKGFVHRDIKPENLLIDRKFKLIIADFNFATQLQAINTEHNFPRFNPIVQRNFNVGSEAYNAPELWIIEQKDSDLRQSQCSPTERARVRQYDAVKSDIFSAAVTFFMMSLKFSPFRRAVLQDPYYKRLAGSEKQKFWKIYNNQKTSGSFKDLFEKISQFVPSNRLTTEQILEHQFLQQKTGSDFTHVHKEILNAYENVQKLLTGGLEPFSDEPNTSHSIQSDTEVDDEQERLALDDEQFENLRQRLIDDVHQISLRLQSHQSLLPKTSQATEVAKVQVNRARQLNKSWLYTLSLDLVYRHQTQSGSVCSHEQVFAVERLQHEKNVKKIKIAGAKHLFATPKKNSHLRVFSVADSSKAVASVGSNEEFEEETPHEYETLKLVQVLKQYHSDNED
jgi:serine/threonine protein kinase